MILLKDESISGLEIGTENFTAGKENSVDVHTKCNMMLKRYNKLIQITEDLQKRMIILEQNTPKVNAYDPIEDTIRYIDR